MKLIYIILPALALFVLLRGGYYFLMLATRGKSMQHYARKYYPVIELILWLLWIFWSIQMLPIGTAANQILFSLSLAALFILTGWYFGRDWFAGVAFRASNAPKHGMHISTGEISGTVGRIGTLSLEIITKTGDHINIPYSVLTGKAINNTHRENLGKEFSFSSEIKKGSDNRLVIRDIKKEVLQMPWVVPTSDVNVTIRPGENNDHVEVSFRCIDDQLLSKSVEILQTAINRLNNFDHSIIPGREN